MSHTHEPVALPQWQRFLSDHADGGVISGRVVSVVPFGTFVELADGINGLLHASTYSTPPVLDSTIDVRIENVDLAGRRMSLARA